MAERHRKTFALYINSIKLNEFIRIIFTIWREEILKSYSHPGSSSTVIL